LLLLLGAAVLLKRLQAVWTTLLTGNAAVPLNLFAQLLDQAFGASPVLARHLGLFAGPLDCFGRRWLALQLIKASTGLVQLALPLLL
jgi:hypothetical protein